MNPANRVILNTGVTYVSLIVKMIIGFFAVRLVLLALGETDYGVYTIVAGVAGMLDILNGNMTNTSMRYMSHSIGSNNQELIKKTFCTTLTIHYLVGIVTILIMEIGGWLMFKYMLNIPQDKYTDAIIIYQFMIVSMFVSVIAVPYDAVMNAHEHIWLLAIFDIISAVLNLGMALFLYYGGGNKLLLYGLFTMLIQILLRIAKLYCSKKRYPECRGYSKQNVDKQLSKEILSFTGWNLFGSLASLGNTQFRSIIINMFFGVRLNAAEGVSRQASSYVNMFAASMTRAINPQIMKSEGGGNRDRMIYITEIGAKYSSFLFALMAVPIAMEAAYLMQIWLKEVPQYAVVFFQLILVQMLIEKFTFQITHAIRAVGNIRNFQIVESIACFVYLPFAFFLFKYGYSPVWIYLLGALNSIIVACVRLYYGNRIAGINVGHYLKSSVMSVALPLVIAVGFYVVMRAFVGQTLLGIVGIIVLYCILFTILFCWLGMIKSERKKWIEIINGLIKKIGTKKGV